MDLFLEQFQITKDLYESDMKKRVAKVLSCDHTFKTSKHVGVTREDDGKFVCQFQNVFLGLNENGEVLTWRFTKSTAYSEIDDLIKELIKVLCEQTREFTDDLHDFWIIFNVIWFREFCGWLSYLEYEQ